MNKRLNALSGVFVFLFLIYPSMCLSSPQPRWLREHMAGTFDLPGLYYGIGSASFKGYKPDYEEKDQAKDRAINDLCYRLSVSVKSTFKEHLAQKGDFSDQNVESSVFVTTRLVLSGVETQEDWTDPKERLYWVIVTIDKDYFLSLAEDDIKHKTEATDFWVKIEPDKGQGADYYHGEKIRFRLLASKGCYVMVIYISSTTQGQGKEKRMNTLLFPNKHDKNNWINAGQTVVIGKLGELRILPPFGKDVVTVVASEKQFSDLNDVLSTTRGRYYGEFTVNPHGSVKMRGRGIEVADIGDSSVASDTCFIVSHPR